MQNHIWSIESRLLLIWNYVKSIFRTCLAQTVGIFVIVSSIALVLLSRQTPVVWEEHFEIGQNLRTTGTLTIDNVPSVFRPPGYPGFVAACLWVADHTHISGRQPEERSSERDMRTIMRAQGLLLGLLAAAFFLATCLSCSPRFAAGISILSALNPYSFALSSLLSYHLLFMFTTSISAIFSMSLQKRQASSWRLTFVSGVLWGVASLVKPVTLVMPLFFCILAIRKPLREIVKSTCVFSLGLMLVVGPYVTRNYCVTGRPIMSAQPGFGFWATSVKSMEPGESFLEWQPIWWERGMPLFSKVTGIDEYSRAALNANVVALNSAFYAEARRNFALSPKVYVYNVMRNFCSFNLDTMQFWPHLLLFNGAQSNSLARYCSDIWMFAFLILSLGGVVWSAAKGDGEAWVVIAVYFLIVFTHAITFSTQLYTCARLPMVILGFMLLMKRLTDTRVIQSGPVVAHCITYAMTAWGAAATILAVIH